MKRLLRKSYGSFKRNTYEKYTIHFMLNKITHISSYGKIDFYSLITGVVFGLISITVLYHNLIFSTASLTTILIIISLLMIFQALFSLYWMLYAWDNSQEETSSKIPDHKPPYHSFTAIIPARHESRVIADTISAVSAMNYPKELTEILVVCRIDDEETIAAAEKARRALNNAAIRVIVFHDDPINKPHALNVGLRAAHHEIVVVFDAEDQPHPDIYSIVNSEFITENADVIQSGVQLMNFRSSWFSALNVLEYFFGLNQRFIFLLKLVLYHWRVTLFFSKKPVFSRLMAGMRNALQKMRILAYDYVM